MADDAEDVREKVSSEEKPEPPREEDEEDEEERDEEGDGEDCEVEFEDEGEGTRVGAKRVCRPCAMTALEAYAKHTEGGIKDDRAANELAAPPAEVESDEDDDDDDVDAVA